MRHLGKAICLVFEQFHTAGIQVHREVLSMLRLNVRMETSLADNRTQFAFPPEEARKFTDACDAMLLLHHKVALHYAQNGVQLFEVTRKCHLLQHVGILAGNIKSRATWCLSGEDFMQKSQLMAQAAVRGFQSTKVIAKLARKYRIAAHL